MQYQQIICTRRACLQAKTRPYYLLELLRSRNLNCMKYGRLRSRQLARQRVPYECKFKYCKTLSVIHILLNYISQPAKQTFSLLNPKKALYYRFHFFLLTHCLMHDRCCSYLFNSLWNLYRRKLLKLIN